MGTGGFLRAHPAASLILAASLFAGAPWSCRLPGDTTADGLPSRNPRAMPEAAPSDAPSSGRRGTLRRARRPGAEGPAAPKPDERAKAGPAPSDQGLVPRIGGKRSVVSVAPPVIIDTDAGADDVLAIAFLLARPDVQIEAITIVNGLSHVGAGARTMTRLVALAGQPAIPVLQGRGTPLSGNAAFPDEWRNQADVLADLPGLPRAPAPDANDAVSFLTRRTAARTRPVRVLALGPLTNLAAALEASRGEAGAIQHLVIMGGAFDAPGNVRRRNLHGPSPPSGDFSSGRPHPRPVVPAGIQTGTAPVAEWNMFLDPEAAYRVLHSTLPLHIVPLDATRHVPIDRAFVEDARELRSSPLGRLVSEVLARLAAEIDHGQYYAWDPLAAAVLVDPGVVMTRRFTVDVVTEGLEAGRTRGAPASGGGAEVAVGADAGRFRRLFFGTLRGGEK